MKSPTPIKGNKPVTGTYLLILKHTKAKSIAIGKLGTMKLQVGYYIYVGSAFGGGGLKSRITRHLRLEKPLRWHIDYLRAHCTVDQVLAHFSSTKLECDWVEKLLLSANYTTPFKGFGASDSPYPSHLFFSYDKPAIADIAELLKCSGLVTISIESSEG